LRIEPLRNFPIIRDLIVDIGDFMRKLVAVKPFIVRRYEKPLSDGEYLQTPDELDEYKQFSMCINWHALLRACPSTAGSRSSSDRRHRGSRSATTWTPRRGRGAADGCAERARRDLGLHVRRVSARKWPQERGPRGGDPALQADGASNSMKAFFMAKGA